MRISPFRGYRYRAERIRDLSAVVAPPYDQISPETQARLYAMSPWNVVRVTLSREPYETARRTLDGWRADGIVERDREPALYPYHQRYSVGGQSVTRKGIIALGEVTDYAQGVVRPHERTHAGPKEDRLRLLEATGADLGLLFMLVEDPGGILQRASDPGGPPLAEATDLRGETHRLWRVTGAEAIAGIQALLADRPVIIADGHHRYETAVEYRRRHPEARGKMMAFFPLEAPGLTILPNHRLVHHVDDFVIDRFLEAASRWFEVRLLPARAAAIEGAIVVVAGARPEGAVLVPRPEARAHIPWPAGTSAAWRALAVSMLHEGLLKPLLDITDAKLDDKTHVDYTADADEAVARVRKGDYQAAFLLAPTTPDELRAVVAGGEVLPQKSTHFYPKLLDGLVFYQLGEE